MGTSYPIARKNKTTLVIDEHSNKFDLILEAATPMQDGLPTAEVELWGLTIEELRAVRDSISMVLSYWGDTEDPWHPTKDAYKGGTLQVDDDPDGPTFW